MEKKTADTYADITFWKKNANTIRGFCHGINLRGACKVLQLKTFLIVKNFARKVVNFNWVLKLLAHLSLSIT